MTNETISAGSLQRPPLKKVAVNSLKCCPLCRAINAVGNQECFSCTWSGVFDHDLESIQVGVDHLVERCPELKLAVISESQAACKISRFKKFILSTFFRKPLDIRV